MHIDFATAIGDPVARGLARGVVKGMAESWTIEGLRVQAAREAGITNLDRTRPQLVVSLRYMVERFPSLCTITFSEVEGWVREANPSLAEAVGREPEVQSWLRRAWETGVGALTKGSKPE